MSKQSMRQIAKELDISPAYLSYMVNGKRPWRKDLYQRYTGVVNTFVNSGPESVNTPGGDGAIQTEKPPTRMAFLEANQAVAGVRGSRTHLPRSSRGTTDLKSARATGPLPLPR